MKTVTFDLLTHKVGLIKPTDAMLEAAALPPNEAVQSEPVYVFDGCLESAVIRHITTKVFKIPKE